MNFRYVENDFRANVLGTPETMQNYGSYAEKRFLRVCVDSFGLAELPPEALKDKNKPKHSAIVRAKEEDDYGIGVDFYVFLPELNKWTPIDITVSNDPKVLDAKLEKERETGIRVVKLNDRDLRNSTDNDIKVAEQACRNIGRDLMTAVLR